MTIRKYKNADCEAVSFMFYDTIHTINSKDYNEKQLSAWADNSDSLTARRRNDLLAQFTLVAEINGKIVGFGSIDKSGCLDLLFVHKDYQKQGIATALCGELEKNYSLITTYSSITAKPFFEKRGYQVIKSHEVERFGVKLKNFKMIKTQPYSAFE